MVVVVVVVVAVVEFSPKLVHLNSTFVTSPRVYGNSAQSGKCYQHVCFLSCIMSHFRFDGTQDWLCPRIVLPKVLAECKDAIDDWVIKHSHARHTAELFPVYSECKVVLNFKGKIPITITCDAVVATILSLFETPETSVCQSDIQLATGVVGELLSAVMEQLCMKRPKDGMATGLLQVPQSFDCVEFVSTHAPCFEQANKDEDPGYRFNPK